MQNQLAPITVERVNSDRTNNRLRVWRTDHGLSVRDVADLTGFDVSTISRVANSKYVQTDPVLKMPREKVVG